MCAQLIHVVYKDGDGRKKKAAAILEDISPSGACLQLEEPIAAATAVSILYPSGAYQGRVKYCEFLRTGYFVGIQFNPGYKWSRNQFKPEHLLQFALRSGKKE